MSRTILAIAALLIALPATAAERHYSMDANEPYPERKEGKVAWATRCAAPPLIDGLIDDPVWQTAAAITDFIQMRPNEGAEPSYPSAVRFLYDDEALYVAFRGWDDQPALIGANPGRRDSENNSDAFYLAFDSRHDHLSAYALGVTAAGTQVDVTISHDEAFDPSWDGIWDAAANIDGEGWTAEFRLPFTIFRFTEKEEMVWGLHLQRKIPRLHEEILWMEMHLGEPGNISRAGHLAGLDGVRPGKALEFLPYGAGGVSTEPGEDLETQMRGGLNLKWGLSPAVTLDAAINPDFGQVEVDPAELNLTAFETFFPERRPFFIEGKDIFAFTEHLNAFHSRRIGGKPGYLGYENFIEGDEELTRPQNTTILSAGKITGKTDRGFNFGVMSAVTAEEFAVVSDSAGIRRERLIEPLTHYFVGNVAREFREGRGKMRLLLTHVGRLQNDDAATAGFGASWRSEDGHSSIGLTAVGSSVELGGERSHGLGGNAWIVTGNRNLNLGLWTHHVDPAVELNDIGYLRRNGVRGLGLWLTGLFHEPKGIFRNGHANLEFEYFTNWDLDKLGRELGLKAAVTMMNYSSMDLGLRLEDASYDDMETRGGPITWSPGDGHVVLKVASDQRRDFFGDATLIRGWSLDGGHVSRLGVGINAQAGDRLQLALSASYRQGLDKSQWIGNWPVDHDDVQATGAVFAELEMRTLDLNGRLNYSFSNHLTLETWLQPFLAWGDYGRHLELASARTDDYIDWAGEHREADFLMHSLNLNAVLRFEYRPGSAMYLVWTRSHYNWEDWEGDFDPAGSLGDNFLLEPESRFMLKLSHWIG